MSIKFLSLEKAFVSILLFLFPILLLTVKGGMNTIFFLLLLLSLIQIVRGACPSIKTLSPALLPLLFISFSLPLLAIFIQQFSSREFFFPAYDSASRLFFLIPIFLYLRKFELKILAEFQFSAALGLIAALLTIYLLPSHDRQGNLASIYFLNHIHLGDLALALGILSVFSINWLEKDNSLVLATKVIGGMLALYISALSGARGGWISLPVALLVWILFRRKGPTSYLTAGSVILASLLLCIITYLTIPAVTLRVDSIFSDVQAFLNGSNKDTSIGIRIQLWLAAWHIFIDHPMTGIGNHFHEIALQFRNAGLITDGAAYFAEAEVHNEILANAVRYGVGGLIASLLVYATPFLVFFKLRGHASKATQVAAIIGMAFVSAFFTFGLTVEIFNLKMTISFFSLMLAILLAIATHPSSVKES